MKLKSLVGSGDKIILFTLPFLIAGLFLNTLYFSFFSVGGPAPIIKIIAIILLIPGIIGWFWAVYLIITVAAKDKLITDGPFSIIKHPIYTCVSLMVIPSVGILLNSWIGIIIGGVMYLISRKYAPEEEKILSETFGSSWTKYEKSVKFPNV